MKQAGLTLVVLAWLCSAACITADDPTSLSVTVRGDAKLMSQLSGVLVQAYDLEATELLAYHEFSLLEAAPAGADPSMALTYAFHSLRGKGSTVRLLAVGLGTVNGMQQPLVEAQTIASFTIGASRTIELYFADACFQKFCRTVLRGSSLTCAAGACVNIPNADDSSLPTGKVADTAQDASSAMMPALSPGLDGGITTDGGKTCFADMSLDASTCACDPVHDVGMDCSLRSDQTAIVWPTGAPTGACHYGKRSCAAGQWGPCVGAREPSASDLCTPGDDSNCNGVPNEGCACANGAPPPCGAPVQPDAGAACDVGKHVGTFAGSVGPNASQPNTAVSGAFTFEVPATNGANAVAIVNGSLNGGTTPPGSTMVARFEGTWNCALRELQSGRIVDGVYAGTDRGVFNQEVAFTGTLSGSYPAGAAASTGQWKVDTVTGAGGFGTWTTHR